MFDVTHIVQAGGLLLVAAIIFSEVGLMVGFFLPGDTLLLSVGIFAGQGKLPIVWSIVVIAIAAILGDNLSYSIGQRLGPRLFKKQDGVIFRQAYIERSEKFFEKYGSKTILFAHFFPIIRTFAPLLAGVGKMPRRNFVLFDLIGDSTWAATVTLIGFWFGRRIPNIDHYIVLAIGAVMVVSFGPTLYHIVKALRQKRDNVSKV